MTSITDLFFDLRVLAIFAVLGAVLLSTHRYLYPGIIYVSKKKGLMDVPDQRKMHKDQVPTLGGLGVFIVFSICIIIFGLVANFVQPDLLKLLSLLGSAIILLFLGIKDDLMTMSPKKKLLGQLLAAAIVVVLTDVRIVSCYGLLGIGELPYLVSVGFSMFVFVLVINALNLIDGIDGLAGSIAVISSGAFGLLFLMNGEYMLTLVSAVLVGSLLGFLKYNFSSTEKIFMGDCGSMLIGFLLAYQGISLLSLSQILAAPKAISNAPILLLAILSYPLFDTLRIFAVRIKQKRSPFSPDSNHIHHRMLKLGLNHKQSTSVLVACNLFVIILALMVRDMNLNLQLLIVVSGGCLLYLVPFMVTLEKTADLKKRNGKTETNLEKMIHEIEVVDFLDLSLEPITISNTSVKLKRAPVYLSSTIDPNLIVFENGQVQKISTKGGKELLILGKSPKSRTTAKKKSELDQAVSKA